jgi:glycosyltransferase involved in cell wall biosynthesis
MIEQQPLVTIVTPSFNQAQYLEETINSVLGQNYPNIEYIIIDGGSADGSVEVIKKYADRLAYWISEPDKGQTEAINKGFAQANGQILAWLNSDDTYHPEGVAKAVAFLAEHPEVGLVYGDTDFIDESGKVMGRFPARQTNHARIRRGYVHIPQQAAFWRAELWEQVGPLDPSFYFAMDYDLWVRLSAISEIKYVPGVWAYFRLHGDSKTIKDDDRCWPEMVRIHRRDGGKWLSVLTIKYVLRRILAPLVTFRRRSRVAKAMESE